MQAAFEGQSLLAQSPFLAEILDVEIDPTRHIHGERSA